MTLVGLKCLYSSLISGHQLQLWYSADFYGVPTGPGTSSVWGFVSEQHKHSCPCGVYILIGGDTHTKNFIIK